MSPIAAQAMARPALPSDPRAVGSRRRRPARRLREHSTARSARLDRNLSERRVGADAQLARGDLAARGRASSPANGSRRRERRSVQRAVARGFPAGSSRRQAGDRRDRAAATAEPAAELLEAHHLPALGAGDLGRAWSGLTRPGCRPRAASAGRRPSRSRRRTRRGRCRAPRRSAASPRPCPRRRRRGRRARRCSAVGADLVAGADAAVHPEHLGQLLDQLVAGGADDEGRAALVLVAVDLVEHLRVDPRQDPGQHLRAHPLDVARAGRRRAAPATCSQQPRSRSSVGPRSR